MPTMAISTNATLVRQGLENLTAEIPQVGRLQIYRTLQRIQKRMRKPGRKSTSPVQWDTPKQKRAYFASDGFGRGIPTKRRNEYVKAWEIVAIAQGYAIRNPLPQAKYIGGGPFAGSQSRIHQDRWELFREVVTEETDKLPGEIQEQIDITVKRRGFA